MTEKKLKSKTKLYNQDFSVSYDYPVYFTHSVFRKSNSLLAGVINRKQGSLPHRVIVYADSGLVNATPDLLSKIDKYFKKYASTLNLVMHPQVIGGGEHAKSGWGDVRNIMTTLGDNHMDRQSFVMALGGGSIQDMVGFATALVHRGLRLIRLPSTVLSQNDAGVGVKNGMNERETKNFVGAFAPPYAVINDYDFLATLKHKDWVGGVSEAFKVAIIKDAGFFDFLCEKAMLLKERDQNTMEEVVYRCAVLHLDHIRTSGDPFEFGSSRPLDFGHWSAHKLEALSGFTIGHGQAVAIGIAMDAFCAARLSLITPNERDKIIAGFIDCGLPIWSHLLEKRDSAGKLYIIEGLEQFREHLGGTLTLAMPKSIGNQCEINHLEEPMIEEGIAFLKEIGDRG